MVSHHALLKSFPDQLGPSEPELPAVEGWGSVPTPPMVMLWF